MKLGAFADFHAGAYPQYHSLAEQEAVLRQAVDVFNAEGVDAILFAGDATHRNKPTPAELLTFIRPLLAARAPIVAINGNTHDVGNADGPIALDLLNRDLYGTLRGSGVLRLSRTPEILELDDLRVATLPWAAVGRLVAARNGGDRDAVKRDAADRLLAVARGLHARIRQEEERIERPLASVLLTHFAIDEDPHGLSKFMHEPVLPLADLLAVGFDAGVAGHLHPPGLMNEAPPWLYCGSPYPLDFGEGDYAHGVWIVDVEPGSATARFVPLESRRFVTLDYDFTREPEFDFNGSHVWTGFGLSLPNVRDAIVRVRYSCTREQARRIDQTAIQRALRDAGAHRVTVEPDIERDQRSRVEGVDENLDAGSALDLWIAHNKLDPSLADALRLRHDRYTAELADAGKLRKTAGGGSIRPLRLRAENFGPYETLDIPFVEGCTVILGEIRDGPVGVSSNGAGKSHILNAIPLALYGPPKGLSLADFLTNDGEGTELMVELTFDRGGAVFRVRRSYSARGAGKSTLDLERASGAENIHGNIHADYSWDPLTGGSQKDTQAAVEELLGLSLETFLASSVRLQDFPSFASRAVSRTERCALLGDALGLDEYDEYEKLAKRDRRTAEEQLGKIASRLERAEQELATKVDVEEALANADAASVAASRGLADAEKRLEALTQEWQAIDRRVSDRRAAEAELDAARQALAGLRAQADAAESARGSITATREALASLADPDALAAAEQAYSEARAAYDRHAHEVQVLNAKRVEAEQRQRELEQEAAALANERAAVSGEAIRLQDMPRSDDACPTCKRSLDDDEARHRVIEAKWAEMSLLEARIVELRDAAREQEARAVALREEIAALGVAVAPDDAELRRCRAETTERARLEERIAAWQRSLDTVEAPEFTKQVCETDARCTAAQDALDALPAVDPREADSVKENGLLARADVNHNRQRLTEAQEAKARLEERLARLATVEAQARIEREARAGLQADVDQLAAASRAYGRDGIPSLVIENVAIPYLETEASRLLERLGLPWQVEIRSERALKSRDGTRAALDVVVVKENGVEQPYQLFSGGEETRIALAMSIALARLLRHRRGAEAQLLALDEPKFLDAAGMGQLVEILRELEAEFPIMILVSHISELRDSFEHTVTVVREDGRSRIEDAPRTDYAPAPEAVAA